MELNPKFQDKMSISGSGPTPIIEETSKKRKRTEEISKTLTERIPSIDKEETKIKKLKSAKSSSSKQKIEKSKSTMTKEKIEKHQKIVLNLQTTINDKTAPISNTILKVLEQGLKMPLNADYQKLVLENQTQFVASKNLEEFHYLEKLIGKGGFGFVYKTFELIKGEHFALKIAHGRGVENLENEWIILRKLHEGRTAEGIQAAPVKITTINGDEGFFKSYFTELMSSDLSLNKLESFHQLKPKEKLNLCKQLLSGLAYMHSFSIYHGDIKPENFLMKMAPNTQKPEKFVIGDFGSAEINKSPKAITPNYFPYENSKPDAKDVFAMSKSLIEILSGKKFDDHILRQEINISNKKINLPIPQDNNEILNSSIQAALKKNDIPSKVIDFLLKGVGPVSQRPDARTLQQVFIEAIL